ncbi:MAG: hypothetical protein ABII18_03125 [bacterium]|nr:hypothetical protein [bacterium]MBU1918045.1 hypothetical protein [bacterium]
MMKYIKIRNQNGSSTIYSLIIVIVFCFVCQIGLTAFSGMTSSIQIKEIQGLGMEMKRIELEKIENAYNEITKDNKSGIKKK